MRGGETTNGVGLEINEITFLNSITTNNDNRSSKMCVVDTIRSGNYLNDANSKNEIILSSFLVKSELRTNFVKIQKQNTLQTNTNTNTTLKISDAPQLH